MWHFHNPVAVSFGPGALNKLPFVLGGRKAVLITFPEAAGLGLVNRVRELIGPKLVGIITDTRPNPDVADLGGLYKDFWQEHHCCDVVIGLGGGSTLDTAKVLMTRTTSGQFDDLISTLASGRTFSPAKYKKLIAIPTTAGTGSEVTPFATIWDSAPERRKKYSLQLRETWAESALVDPELTLSLPAAVTLHSGLDALSHSLEAIWNVNANPVSDQLAVAAAREVIAALPALMASAGDVNLRTRLSRAALTAGLAFSNTKTALAHSISYEMTLRYGLPHGLACSFTLPMVFARALGRSAARDAVLARIFDDRPLADAPGTLNAFLARLGVSTGFGSYGVAAGEAKRIVEEALQGIRGRNFIGAPAC
ncbi:MAG: iron-containing alcohol dehydrogenase family protein [Betaproteobacteria bacterium]|nr:iron-containing alcohol dehydrogenase family protein [Betaproteobacteria bacterium]